MSRVSGVVAIVLCTACFLLGRLYEQSVLLPEPSKSHGQAPRLEAKAIHLGRQDATAGKVVGRGLQQATASIGPLDPVQLEHYFLEASNLTRVRPAVPAGVSGDSFLHAIPFQILSWYPRLVVFPSFIDAERCEHIIKLATERMYPSGLAFRPGEAHTKDQDVRTSKGAYLAAKSDPAGVLGWLEERLAAATHLPAENGEPFNVLHYQKDQHYDSHYDTFDPKDYGPQPSQRIATVLVYLSEVEEGGETVFKREGVENGEKAIEEWRSCDDGAFMYKPRRGDAVLFWAVAPNGDIDPHALHGGCPVKKGEKWVATKWIRSKGLGGTVTSTRFRKGKAASDDE